VIAVLAASGSGLRAVDRLVSVNREITTRTLPALHLAASIREAIAPLARLETHAVVLGDSRYEEAWADRRASCRGSRPSGRLHAEF